MFEDWPKQTLSQGRGAGEGRREKTWILVPGAGAGSGHPFLALHSVAHAGSLNSKVVGVFTLWTLAKAPNQGGEKQGGKERPHSVRHVGAEVAFGS